MFRYLLVKRMQVGASVKDLDKDFGKVFGEQVSPVEVLRGSATEREAGTK